jgi:general secretion pathway protein I
MKSRALGFTLLEVLAALVIVSLGMLGVIEAVSQTASNGAYLRDKSIAHWIAMNQLTMARLAQQPPKIDKTSDEIEMADRQWRWTMEVSQTPLDSVRRIDITVRLEDADENSSLAAVTGFYGTAIAQPGTAIVAWQGENQPPNGGPDDGKDEDDGEPEQPPKTPPSDEPPEPDPVDPPPEPAPEPAE